MALVWNIWMLWFAAGVLAMTTGLFGVAYIYFFIALIYFMVAERMEQWRLAKPNTTS